VSANVILARDSDSTADDLMAHHPPLPWPIQVNQLFFSRFHLYSLPASDNPRWP